MLSKGRAKKFTKALAKLSRKHGVAIGLAHSESDKMPFLVGLEEGFEGFLYAVIDHGRKESPSHKQYMVMPRLGT